MAVQPGLCGTWSETPKTGFLTTRLILYFSYFCSIHAYILLALVKISLFGQSLLESFIRNLSIFTAYKSQYTVYILAKTPNRPHMILMQDNSTSHSARATRQYLATNNVQVMDWSARSPDLTPIEYIWDLLDRRLRNARNPPQTVAALCQEVVRHF